MSWRMFDLYVDLIKKTSSFSVYLVYLVKGLCVYKKHRSDLLKNDPVARTRVYI